MEDLLLPDREQATLAWSSSQMAKGPFLYREQLTSIPKLVISDPVSPQSQFFRYDFDKSRSKSALKSLVFNRGTQGMI